MLLACTVVFWGVQYKVSLYRSPAAQRSIPAAKLLSQDERPCTTAVVHIFLWGRTTHHPASRGLFEALTLRLTETSFIPSQSSLLTAHYQCSLATGSAAVLSARGPPALA